MGQYLILEFFPILQESRGFPLFGISHMILFSTYLDHFIYEKHKLLQVFCAQNTISSTLFNDQTPEIYPGKKENTLKIAITQNALDRNFWNSGFKY